LFWSLDRFSREGSRETLNYLTRLDDYGIKWHSYAEQYISSLGVFSDAIISILSCLAKQERIRISERTKAGLERVKAKGVKLGRPAIAPDLKEKVVELRNEEFSLSKIANEVGVSKTRVHQILNPAT
jgi:putative DNA-invertase from lambdoid prophage Rac